MQLADNSIMGRASATPGWLVHAAGIALGLAGAAHADERIRTAVYAPDEVYRLQGYAGYQIDLEFERGESFVGLGAGDVESLTFSSQANHLFLKPRATDVETNLTVLTSLRTYHFQYLASARRPDPSSGEVVYVLSFVYAPAAAAAEQAAQSVEHLLVAATNGRARNLDYGYCGSAALKPQRAWDDGVQTHLQFGARQELPAVFVRGDDGSESLVNFTVAADELILHRVARRFVVRRGQLYGCIVNERFAGTGEALHSGTVAPSVTRHIRQSAP